MAAGDFVDDEDVRFAPEVERFAGGGGGGGERRMALGGGDVFLEPARAGAQEGVDFFARHAHGGREQGAAVGLDAQRVTSTGMPEMVSFMVPPRFCWMGKPGFLHCKGKREAGQGADKDFFGGCRI